MKEAYINKNPEILAFSSFDVLLDRSKYIGFQSSSEIRYMLIQHGSAQGYAINHQGTYTTQEDQKIYEGPYFLFDNLEEFLIWLYPEAIQKIIDKAIKDIIMKGGEAI